ncbi:MAG TPA: nucleotidyltransferase domain-containing protein [Chloroflexota bacterium]|nr:nucleotidyltransferase domain-containing protein [Chloroflexota bacterium]
MAAVVVGGSMARGEGRPDSDLDLGIYYHPGRPPSIAALREVAARLDDRHSGAAVTELGAWGPWINGGAWLRIGGRKVDWIFRDLSRVTASIADSREGRIAVHYQPGHPFGFVSYTYLGEVANCVPLYDPAAEIASLKALAVPYPPFLKRAIVDRFLWEADFTLETARSPASRGDVSYVAGCLFRAAFCLAQVLFALNERYLINEKGAVAAAGTLPIHVPGFTKLAEGILGRAGETPQALHGSIECLGEMVAAVRDLVSRV